MMYIKRKGGNIREGKKTAIKRSLEVNQKMGKQSSKKRGMRGGERYSGKRKMKRIARIEKF